MSVISYVVLWTLPSKPKLLCIAKHLECPGKSVLQNLYLHSKKRADLYLISSHYVSILTYIIAPVRWPANATIHIHALLYPVLSS